MISDVFLWQTLIYSLLMINLIFKAEEPIVELRLDEPSRAEEPVCQNTSKKVSKIFGHFDRMLCIFILFFGERVHGILILNLGLHTVPHCDKLDRNEES